LKNSQTAIVVARLFFEKIRERVETEKKKQKQSPQLEQPQTEPKLLPGSSVVDSSKLFLHWRPFG